MKAIHHARDRMNVPAGFSGWWCQRCEKPVNLPEEAGSPAKCPHCRKWTVVWVPATDVVSVSEPKEPRVYERTRPTAEHAKQLFEEMKAAANGAPPTTDEDYTR